MSPSQEDPSQVPGGGDGVALRTQLLRPLDTRIHKSALPPPPGGVGVARVSYQCPQPALLAVDVPALDGGEGGGVRVLHGDAKSELQCKTAAARGQPRLKALVSSSRKMNSAKINYSYLVMFKRSNRHLGTRVLGLAPHTLFYRETLT